MKTKILCILFLFFSLSEAYSSEPKLDCSNAQGTHRLEVGHYDGGAAPPEWMPLNWINFYIDGTKIENVTYQISKKKKIKKTKTKFSRNELFSAFINIQTPTGDQFESYMICEKSSYFGPPAP